MSTRNINDCLCGVRHRACIARLYGVRRLVCAMLDCPTRRIRRLGGRRQLSSRRTASGYGSRAHSDIFADEDAIMPVLIKQICVYHMSRPRFVSGRPRRAEAGTVAHISHTLRGLEADLHVCVDHT